MNLVKLEQLLKRHATASTHNKPASQLGTPVVIEDLKGKAILGEPPKSPQAKYPIEAGNN